MLCHALGSAWATISLSANDTPALNALKALRGAPISMGRGDIPVGGCQPPSVFAVFFISRASARIGFYAAKIGRSEGA